MKKEPRVIIADASGEINSFVANTLAWKIKNWFREDPNILDGFEEWEKEYLKNKKEASQEE